MDEVGTELLLPASQSPNTLGENTGSPAGAHRAPPKSPRPVRQAAVLLVRWATWASHLSCYTCPSSRAHHTIPRPQLKLSSERIPEISLLREVRVMRMQ